MDAKKVRLRRRNGRRRDGLSSSLQIAKAGEHFVCYNLILRGFNAFLSDAGQPYDVIVDYGNGKFCRIQVKATTRMYGRGGTPLNGSRTRWPVYRFPFRRSRTGNRKISMQYVDVVALVALDASLVAWLSVTSITSTGKTAKTMIEFKTRKFKYGKGRAGCDPAKVGKFIEDYSEFPPK